MNDFVGLPVALDYNSLPEDDIDCIKEEVALSVDELLWLIDPAGISVQEDHKLIDVGKELDSVSITENNKPDEIHLRIRSEGDTDSLIDDLATSIWAKMKINLERGINELTWLNKETQQQNKTHAILDNLSNSGIISNPPLPPMKCVSSSSSNSTKSRLASLLDRCATGLTPLDASPHDPHLFHAELFSHWGIIAPQSPRHSSPETTPSSPHTHPKTNPH